MSVERIHLSAVLEKAPILANLTPPELQMLAARTVCIYKSSANGWEQVLAVNLKGESIAEIVQHANMEQYQHKR